MVTSVNCWTGEFKMDGKEKGFTIPEASLLHRVLAAIPVFGIFFQIYSEVGMDIEYNLPEKQIKLLEVKNDYKKTGIGRDLISAAVIITLVALGITGAGGVTAILIAAGLFVISMREAYRIYKNNEAIEQLKQSDPSIEEVR